MTSPPGPLSKGEGVKEIFIRSGRRGALKNPIVLELIHYFYEVLDK